MSLPLAARLAARELRGGLAGFRVFLACLAFGVAAIAAVGSVREAITAGLTREGATILGGDAVLEFTYRFATSDERAFMEETAERLSEIVDFRSMLFVEGDQALTQVKAVDAAYPILGEVILDPPIPLSQALADNGAVVDRVLADRLGLSAGDVFRLGTTEFRLSAILLREPDSAVGGLGLGPRTILRTEDLEESGLLAAGTLFETEYRLLLPPEADLDAVEARVQEGLDGAGARWQDRREGAPRVQRFVDRLGAFLVLVGLAGLIVGGVGIAAAVRSYLDGKIEVIATLRSLGATRATVFQTYMLQIGALTVLGIVLGLLLGGIAPLLAAPLIETRLPVPAEFSLFPGALAEAALYGALAAALFTIWPLAATERVRAAALFRDAGLGQSGWPRPIWMALTALLLAALVGFAAMLSGLAMLTLWAAAGLACAFVTLLLAAWIVRRVSGWAARRITRPAGLRRALAAVGGPGTEAGSVILSLGLGLTVLASIGQIDANLRGSIARDLPEVAPSYFVVDIQTAQLQEFLETLEAHGGVSEVQTAPMLRGIITRINGRPAAEVAGNHWVIQGDRGITYAATPPDGTTMTAGAWWDADYTGPPLVSFAAEEAEEIGLSLGDMLTVNVLGREIEAEITSFREVDFSTAGIGFILSMNPAALARAPHSHIATIYADPETEAAILRDLAGRFPNITAIRVKDAIDRVSDILKGVASAITWGAMATLLTGGVVLIGTAAAVERARIFEAAVLKTLGASRASILVNFALRSAILGAAAGLVAIAAGAAGGWGVMHVVMEADYVFEPRSAIMVILAGLALTLLAGLAYAWRPLRMRPARVLRARE